MSRFNAEVATAIMSDTEPVIGDVEQDVGDVAVKCVGVTYVGSNGETPQTYEKGTPIIPNWPA